MKLHKMAEPRGPRPRGSAMTFAQKAAIEKELSRYIPLVCGHNTTVEVVILYGCFGHVQPFCETCGDWRELAKKLKVDILPSEPLF